MLLRKILIGLLCVVSLFSQSRQTDSLALVAVYNALDGANWSSAWNLESSMNNWSGLTISNDRVTQLNLYNRNLSGMIPSEIGNLSELTYLYMGYDAVTGSIPASIGDLKKLDQLNLRNLELTTIPEEIGRLTDLRYLYLFNNNISTLPDSIIRLKKLVNLHLYNNNISSLPDSIGQMTDLRSINFNSNNLTSIPSSIASLSSLEQLFVSNNLLSSIPVEIYYNTSLQEINIENNSAFSTLPSDISNTTELRLLRISGTAIRSFPTELTSLAKLNSLFISNLNLTSIPDVVFDITPLTTLDISGNSLNSISPNLSKLTNLVTLYAENNLVEWNFPTAILDLSNLTSLYLRNSKLIGNIPSGIDALANLRTLYAYSNQLSGPIPSELGNITNLYNLRLQNNQLTGPIPNNLTNLTSLDYLYLYNNQLSGNLPDSLNKMTSLRYLYAENNQLSGTIPSTLALHNSLSYIQLHNNKFDSLPDFTGTNLDAVLQNFYVQGNNLGFDDLIPNIGVASYFPYNPQNKYGLGIDTSGTLGQSITFTAKKSHVDDEIQWYKGTQLIKDSTNVSLTIDSLTNSNTGIYSYKLTNAAIADLTLTSADYRVLIPDTVAPPTVSNFQASPRNGAIYLSWNASNQSDFSMFYIYGEPTVSKASTLIDSTTSTNYTVTGLENGREYQFSLTAKDFWGNESNHTMDKKLSPDSIPPSAPTGLVATAGEESVLLTWDQIPDNDFAFYRVLYGITENDLSPYTTSSTNSRTINGLINGQEYFFAVLAVDIATNEGDTSNVVSATPEDIAPPAPINVSAIPNNGMITITWNIERQIPDFKSYKVYMGESSSPTTVADSLLTQYSVNDSRLKFDFNGLSNNTPYFFRLKTFDTNGNESSYSAEVSTAPDNYRELDSLALVQFYNDMDGANWTSAWDLNSDMSSWSGVTILNNRVTQLSLYNRNLSGKISRAIKDLPELTFFYIGNDPIVDSIPSEIGQLTKLTYLHIRNTEIRYAPAEIGLLKNLTALYLRYNNQLSKIDANLSDLDQLSSLDIYSNALEELPDGISEMAELTSINAYSNQITSLPATIVNSPKLTLLQMQTNKLSTLPANFENLSTLTSLNLSANEFTEFPESIASLTNLTSLEFSANDLNSVPAAIALMTKLTNLNLSTNNITSIPNEISNVVNLQTLNLSSNGISSFPSILSSLTNLQNLNLSSNNLSGTFPVAALSMTNLRYLYLNSNNLTGPIPTAIGNLTQMNTFYANHNNLSGEIPDGIANMSSLSSLRLNNNKLTGDVPESFGSLENLTYLHLQDNMLDGTLPSNVSAMVRLNQFYVYNNQLTGTLPSGLDALVNMDYFYVYNNKLTGAVPEAIKNNPRIYYLNLQDNLFTEIPDLTASPLDARVYSINITNNKLGFDQIIKNVGVASGNYYYSPQKAYGTGLDTITTIGQNLVLNATKSHQDDQIQWFKNGQVLSGETTDSLRLDSLTEQSIGRYSYTLKNSAVSLLTLESEAMNVLMIDTIAPANVTGLSRQVRNSSVILNWNANNEVDFDKFYIYQSAATKAETLVDSTSNNTITISGLTNGTNYQFSISAKDRWGNESLTRAQISATPDGTPPSVPANFTVIVKESRVDLRWDRVPETDGIVYRIHRGNTASTVNYWTNTTANSYNVTGLLNGEDYFFAISAYDAALNEGDTTDILSATPVNLTPPQIVGLSVTEANEQLVFNWTNPSLPDFDRYTFYFGTDANPSEDNFSTSTSTTFTKTGLANGTRYYFRIKVRDDDGVESPLSDIISGVPGNYFEADSLALVAIYNAMGGDNWSSAWDLNNDVSSWNGVSVSNGRVTGLSLYNRNLTGSIPSEIGDLTALRNFSVGADVITDSLPSSIGNLKSLTSLQVQNTHVSGFIPSSIGELSTLTSIYLGGNQFTGSIPESIGNLVSLTQLNLSSNELTGSIPSSLGNLVKMDDLYLNNNDLTGQIPESLGNLVLLDYLYLSDNKLTGEIPTELGNLDNMRRMYLNNNELSGAIPVSIGNLAKVQYIYLQNNSLSGAVPSEFGNLSTIIRLDIQNNNLNDFPDLSGTSFASNIQRIYMDENKFEFDDIAPNIGITSSTFDYNPQQALAPDTTLYVTEGESIQLMAVTAAASGNSLQWYKNNSPIASANAANLSVSNYSAADNGSYHARITNPNVSGLTLYSGYTNLSVRVKPSISTSLFQNPAAAKYADIIVSSDMVLKSSSEVQLKGPKKTKTLALTRVNQSTYKASHKFTETGTHTVKTTANGISELDSVQIRKIKVIAPKYNALTTVTTPNLRATLSFTSKDFPKDIYLMAIENEASVQVSPSYALDEKSQIEISFSDLEFESAEKLFVYRKTVDGWQRLDSKVFEGAKKVRAEIRQLGEFKIAEDKDYDGNNLQVEEYVLGDNYPNPFNPTTRIPFTLKENTDVKVFIYNTLGQRIKTLVNGFRQADSYELLWHGLNENGKKVASGMYFYQIVTPNFVKTKKMLLIK
jgi:Leucine-rich repeat (LRR) protein